MDSTSPDADALRIQAAALVAQQTALAEDEARLDDRKRTLEQQEAQLANLLDEKRRRLLALRDEIQQSRISLQAEQAAYHQQVTETAQHVEVERVDIGDEQVQLAAERRRLLRLRRRLKQRWHRNWAKERDQLRAREASLLEQAQRVAQYERQLTAERQATEQRLLAINGEAELTRRELRAEAESLQQERSRCQERAANLERRESEVAKAQRELAGEQRRWQKERVRLQHESLGLKSRIQNQRCKLIDLERRAKPLGESSTVVRQEPAIEAGTVKAPEDLDAALRQRTDKVAALERELADQRLLLTEHWQRLLMEQQAWTEERDNAAVQLEELAQNLDLRERGIETGELRCRQLTLECNHQRRYLHGIQAQWTARLSTWHGERERLLSDLRRREELVVQSQSALAHVLRKWQHRYQDAVVRLKSEYASCQAERQEYVRLRDELVKRLAEAQVPLHVRGEVENLHREAVQIDSRFEHLKQWRDELASKDAELANLLSTMEQGRASAEADTTRLRHDLRALQAQVQSYRGQVAELSEEVERIARLLIGEGEPASLPLSQAA